MCGIWCCISTFPSGCSVSESISGKLIGELHNSCDSECPVCSSKYKNIFEIQNEFNCRRGPDLSSQRCFQAAHPPAYIHLVSHVLWTQGEAAEIQPYSSSCDSKLMLFNGDIYSFSSGHDPEEKLDMEQGTCQNDGLTLFQLLEQCKSEVDFCKILGKLQGPFAFIFIDLSLGSVWFARDFFGRESLLFSFNELINSWHISSVSVLPHVLEIPASALFCLDMNTKFLTVFRYNHIRESVSALEAHFFQTLKTSGFISQITVCDTKINLNFCAELKFPDSNEEISKDSILNSLLNEAKLTSSGELFIKRSIVHFSSYIDSFIEQLSRSVKQRVLTLPPFCKNCLRLEPRLEGIKQEIACYQSKVGVLFSGGIDSTVIAYLAAEQLQPESSLDLINVAFSKDGNFSSVPDRETALASYKMLHEHFKPQGKSINLVLVNVGKAEVEEWRQVRIKHLISPLTSVLDDSIGVCLWFAARGVGILYENSVSDLKNYASPIRVVLLCSVADECLGGYGRHRSAYEKSGWKGLKSEMQLDFDRISIRNMGRDNRIVSDHGICPRMPFLDERVVDFLVGKCDLWVKCCPANVGPLGLRGSGEKLLLRAVAAKLFGEQYLSLALFPKRAMQFGSKIAKLENSKEKGGDSCQRLL